MPRRCIDYASEDGPPKKQNCNMSFDLRHDEYLTDITGKQWKLGKTVGVGGFGQIYLASDVLSGEVKTDSPFVAKIEHHSNGPLFVEINCYLRIARPTTVAEWKAQKKLNSLGMPLYVASGSHVHKNTRYRFLILQRFDKDLEKILQEKKVFNLKTVLTISSQILNILEYLHHKGYIHSDIKASNILLSSPKKKKTNKLGKSHTHGVYNPLRACRIKKSFRYTRNLRPTPNINYAESQGSFSDMDAEIEDLKVTEKESDGKDQVYLLDYGLACKYLFSNGEHKPFCVDERKAHAGTILFCSRDAHKGVASRRSDLESLGYNIIYWLTGKLPWMKDSDDPEIVDKKKQRALADPDNFLRLCFKHYPKFLLDYFKYLQTLQFQEKPKYSFCRNLFKKAIETNGYKNDSRLDFDNLEPCKNKKKVKPSENRMISKVVYKIMRTPLKSNIPVKPRLRKKSQNKKLMRNMSWSKILIDNPEVFLRQARERKHTESGDGSSTIEDLNIYELNPTYAMLEVYNKCKERGDASPAYKGDNYFSDIEGYTPAMTDLFNKIKERKEIEEEKLAVISINNKYAKTAKKTNKRKKKLDSRDKSPPVTRTKSASVVKKDGFQGRKVKSLSLRRTYSLRG